MGYVVAQEQATALSASGEVEALTAERGLVLYELCEPGWRVRGYCGAVYEPDDEAALDRLVVADADPDQPLILHGEGAGRPGGPCGTATITDETERTVGIDADLPEDSWVYLADTHHPGWSVHVDFEPAEILEAVGAFRAVAVRAGAHRVEFRCDSAPFEKGPALSVGALVVGATSFVAVAVALRRRRIRSMA